MQEEPKPSRRSLALLLGLPALPLSAALQPPPVTDPRETLRKDGAELAAVKVPRDCAPDFRFQP
ncbi:hypothetical protein [uncultured Paludibaculum sp.]|uniref:hypothetical protein n=1 Tax=uncultured Paludibaculum sp. TaxID=1765020 RepID=UPI002AAB79B1|nr:hypothetical protein [uncultured Paludibaculum sp.]